MLNPNILSRQVATCPFIKGVKENLPCAEITYDKFHIIKLINEAVDKVRREEATTNPMLK